ncbi:MAG TPA: S8 family serine peptidase, partial [Trueperaceae bacterium]|nr:S8 family serine peptidase [Trueperaceae bacterium]
WVVGQTAAAPSAGEFVRLEVRRAGAASGQACNAPAGACLGYLDAQIVSTGSGSTSAADAEFAAAATNDFIVFSDEETVAVNFSVLDTGSGGEEGGELPANLGDLFTVSGQGTDKFNETAGNCSSDDFERPGQGLQAVGAGLQAVGAGLQAVGAVGGLFVVETPVDAATADALDALVTTNAVVAAQVLAGLGDIDYGNQVAILVVDDFNGVLELPTALLAGQVDLNGLDDLVALGQLSHGALVFHQIRELASAVLGDRGSTSSSPHTNNPPYVKFQAPRNARLLLQPVDAHDLDTDQLATKIRDAIAAMTAAEKITHFVVNMSFAIVPCTVQDDFSAVTAPSTSDIATFEEYVQALLEVNEIAPQYLDELGLLVSTPLELSTDPFFAYLDCPLPSLDGGLQRCDGKTASMKLPVVQSLVHVASSGNFGNDYALYPAALPTVISVGSLDVDGEAYSSARSDFSNAATVLAPGALFKLAQTSDQTIVSAGTSFAAPVTSLFTALDLVGMTRDCDPGDLSTNPISAPALATTDLDGLPLVPAFTNGGPDAVSALCATD